MSQPVIIIAPQSMTAEQVHEARASLAFIGRRAAWADFAAAAVANPNCWASHSAIEYADDMIAAFDERFPDAGAVSRGDSC